MENLSVEATAQKIRLYLSRDTLRPYFVISDVAAKCERLKKLFGGFKQIYISDLCAGDYLLDVDLLVERLKSLDNDALVFGLGEYI